MMMMMRRGRRGRRDRQVEGWQTLNFDGLTREGVRVKARVVRRTLKGSSAKEKAQVRR